MKFDFEQIHRFVAPLQCLRELNDSIHLVFQGGRCKATVVDTAHVSLSIASWGYTGSPDTVAIYLKLSSLVTALGLSSDDKAPFSLVVDSPGSDTMTVVMDDGDTHVNLKLLDGDMDDMDVFPYDQSVKVEFDTWRIKNVCRELSTIGDTVALASGPDGHIVLTTTGDIGTARITMRPLVITNPKNQHGVSISLRYLNSIFKSHTISSVTHFSIEQGMPLKVSLLAQDVGLECFVAPKLEDDVE